MRGVNQNLEKSEKLKNLMRMRENFGRVRGTPQFLSVKFWIQHNELQSILHLVITGS